MNNLAEEIKRIENAQLDVFKIFDGIDKLNINYEDIKTIERATRYCMLKHFGQKRTEGTNYSAHPIIVARIVIDAIKNDKELTLAEEEKVTAICSALLHDVLEDTETTYEELMNEFGEEVAACVEKLTKPKKSERREGYEDAYFQKAFSNKLSAIIKLADRIHNVRTEDAIDDPIKIIEKAAETTKFIILIPAYLRKNCSNYLLNVLEDEMEHTYKNYCVDGPKRLRTGETYRWYKNDEKGERT